jgi:hypothetical protein
LYHIGFHFISIEDTSKGFHYGSFLYHYDNRYNRGAFAPNTQRNCAKL